MIKEFLQRLLNTYYYGTDDDTYKKYTLFNEEDRIVLLPQNLANRTSSCPCVDYFGKVSLCSKLTEKGIELWEPPKIDYNMYGSTIVNFTIVNKSNETITINKWGKLAHLVSR
jgi:hypothetical protein